MNVESETKTHFVPGQGEALPSLALSEADPRKPVSRTGSSKPSSPKYKNEDSKHIDTKGRFALVADGMGGHAKGEVASKLAIEIIRKIFEKNYDNVTRLYDMDVLVRRAVNAADFAIREYQKKNVSAQGMGTTISLVVIWYDAGGQGHAIVANVGDSRVYLRKAVGKTKQLTPDDSWVQMMVDDEKITPAEAEVHIRNNWIADSLSGKEETKELKEHQLKIIEVNTNDNFLLMTDGSFGNLGSGKIA